MKQRIMFMPHPPIIIEEIGGKEREPAQETIQGMKALAKKVGHIQPDTIIFITPHGNAFSDATCILDGEAFEGSFQQFGHPKIGSQKVVNRTLTKKIVEKLRDEKINTVVMTQELADTYNIRTGLDHGVLVPIYFIDKEYDTYTVVHITPGFTPLSENYQIGQCINQVIESYAKETGQEILVLVSGDLSHALKDSGPYAYHPDGIRFDTMVQNAIHEKRVDPLLDLSSDFIDNAAQCGLRPYLIGFGLLEGGIDASQIFSYEGPFGVGYLTAYMEGGGMMNGLSHVDEYVQLARKSIEHYVKTHKKYTFNAHEFSQEFVDEAMSKRSGVFVSIHKHGNLRGCIGTIQGVNENIIEEIIYNGISACSSDPRFNPVAESELEDLEVKVDVLMPIEPIKSAEQLDVDMYGVIVEQGIKRGLLLPRLEGVDTVEEQINIAKQKAGITEGSYALFRFKVERHE